MGVSNQTNDGVSPSLEADVIIVGGGSAGCLLANRLSENPSLQVILIEAGGEDKNPWIHIPLGYVKTIADKSVNWCYQTEPAQSLGSRQMHYPLGKVLGGSSSINGLAWVHGQVEDFDEWEAAAGPDWGRAAMLKALHAVEEVPVSLSLSRGRGPGVKISLADIEHPLLSAAISAGVSVGLQVNEDYNSGDQSGIGPLQVTIADGRRVSAVDAFLKPVRRRANLRVLTSTRVTRILFNGLRALGVETLSPQGRLFVMARREVVLSAGAIHTPQILSLSGVGPAIDLQRLGIGVRVDLPDVGKHLQDHVQLRCVYRAQNVNTLNQLFHSKPEKALAIFRYALNRSGCLAQGALRAVAFADSQESHSRPDLQLFFSPFSTDQLGGPPHKFPGMSISVIPLRPKSRGQLTLSSADIDTPPRIYLPYLENADDMSLALKGIDLARRIASQSALRPWLTSEIFPGPEKTDVASLEAFARQQATTIFHPVGTCRMGTDKSSVVDSRMKVRGIECLRVVDASIMPNITSGNTNAPTFALAQRASLILKQDLH